MSKLILVSFADKRFRNSLKRLKENTENFPFDERYFLTQETSLNKEYWRKLKPWLYRRGYGYWAWKAAIIKEYMQNFSDGDLLFWSDGGIHWNGTSKALKRFNEYVGMVNNKTPLLTFQQPTLEHEYTKGDVLNVLDVYENNAVCESLQLWAGCFLIMKTPEMMSFLDRWIELNDLSKEFVTDKRSSVPNKIGFKEHRHDQSIFSVLAKQNHHVTIPWTEIQPINGDWECMKDYPIQGRRLKELDRSKKEIIKNKLLRPWRDVLHFYFKYIRKYEYKGKYVW